MKLEERIRVLSELAAFLAPGADGWSEAAAKASAANAWFHPRFVEGAAAQIRQHYLQDSLLNSLARRYAIPPNTTDPRTVGIVMAGNIPLVGMHDLVCTFLSGHRLHIKPSERDHTLITYVVDRIRSLHPEAAEQIAVCDRLNGCDAYIATGSDNTARHFERYFSSRPNIIRRNRTSVAILDGTERAEELQGLADDICQYYGLGCRNVTQILVPAGYDFSPLLEALKAYEWLAEAHRYKNNLDYQMTLLILNRRYYMSCGALLLTEDDAPFSPIGQLHYRFIDPNDNISELLSSQTLQCIVGKRYTPFGQAQSPTLDSFADGVDTMAFLQSLG